MRVVVRLDAERDAEETQAWWREHRPDAPLAVAEDLEAAFARLAEDGAILPVYTWAAGLAIRRLHLPRTHRHLYFAVEGDRVLILAVWGSVRGLLPKLRERARAVE